MNEVTAMIVPLSIVMMAGPQLISPILMMTTDKPGRVLAVYSLAVGIATSIGVLAFYYLFQFLGVSSFGEGDSTISKIVQTGFLILLFYLSINTFLHRHEAKTPRWMSGLEHKTVKGAFLLGLGLILFMPTDLVAMATVALTLQTNQLSVVDFWPFLVATVFISAIPLLAFLIFHKKINDKMDAIRTWIEVNNWIIQIAVYIIFIYLIWS